MRRSRQVGMLVSMLFGLEGILAAQATLEYGLGASRAATSAATSKGAATAVGGIAGGLDKVLKKGKEAADSASSSSSAPAPGATAAGKTAPAPGNAEQVIVVPAASIASAEPSRVYEDPSGIQKGMARGELIERFGPPSLDVEGAAGLRTLSYKGKNNIYELEVREDKVSRITAMNSHQSALVLPGGKQ